MVGRSPLTAKQVLQRYKAEYISDFAETPLTNVNQRGRFGDMPLHVAANRGNLDEVNALLIAGADVNAKGERDYIPLHYAAINGHIAVIVRLLEAGSLIDARTEFGATARDIALRRGHSDAVSKLEIR